MCRRSGGLFGSWAMVAIAACLLAFEINMVLQMHALVERLAS